MQSFVYLIKNNPGISFFVLMAHLAFLTDAHLKYSLSQVGLLVQSM